LCISKVDRNEAECERTSRLEVVFYDWEARQELTVHPTLRALVAKSTASSWRSKNCRWSIGLNRRRSSRRSRCRRRRTRRRARLRPLAAHPLPTECLARLHTNKFDASDSSRLGCPDTSTAHDWSRWWLTHGRNHRGNDRRHRHGWL